MPIMTFSAFCTKSTLNAFFCQIQSKLLLKGGLFQTIVIRPLLILFVLKSATKLFKVGVEYGAMCAYDVTPSPLDRAYRERTSYFHVIVIALLGFIYAVAMKEVVQQVYKRLKCIL